MLRLVHSLCQADGFIFYFGSEMGTGSYITGQLLDGNLVVKVYFDGKKEKFQVYTVDLSDGYRHFIRVVRMTNSMMVKVCLLFSCLFTIHPFCLQFSLFVYYSR